MARHPVMTGHDWGWTRRSTGGGGGRVAGRYHLKRSLGQGASKEVFLAHRPPA